MLGKTLYFVGVHALNTGEERLVRQMESALGATVFVDGDELYIRDIQDHEAGTFLRGLLKENATLQWIGDHFRTSKKEIRISEATTGIGQVFAAVKYWQDAPPGESKVVVLNDEQLVTPLRKAFADEGLHVSFKGTSALQSLAYRWMHNWLELQVRMEEQGERSALPARELVRFFSSAMVTMSEPQLGGNFREWVIRNNKVFVGRNDLEKFSPKSEWVKQVLLGWNRTPAEWLKAAEAFLQRHGEEEGADYGMVEEYRSAKMWLSQLELSLEIQGIRYESLLHLLKLLVSQHRLREEVGEGEKVQVMGLLETRSLDFDHVIMLSADEKNLPKSSSYNSFIPHDIRALFHLPVRHDREALFAYNFYRLLQRASKIDILYSMASDDFNRTEPSRYITQIRNEFPSYNPNIVLTEVKVKIPGARAGSEKIVATNDFIRNKLDELFASGISPSALNTYNRCSLDFYYKYLVGLNEAEEAEENIDRAVFGQVVHKTLENFYGNFVDSFPGVKDLTEFAENARKFVEECLTDAEFSKYDWTGENALALEIAVAMVSKFAVTDLEEGMEEEVTRIIKGIEVPLEWNIRSEDSGWHTDVILRGKADRIEQFGSLVRILDYKTGQVNNTDALIPKKLEEMFGPNAKPKLLQLLIYQYVHCRMHGLPPGNVIPGLYSMKNHTQGTVWLHADSKMGELPGLDTIEKGILSMVKRIYETEMFTHNPKSDFCSYCES